jgi:hypothetical protein
MIIHMGENDKNALPQPTGWDHAHIALKTALSAVPMVGSPAAELFAAIIAPPLARRRDEWLQSLADGLAALREQIDAESLAQNEAFISATMQASRAAIQTHQKEKLDALRNAVLNVAAGRAPEEDEQAMFLWYIETLTTWHIRVLKFFDSPLRTIAQRGARTDFPDTGALANLLESAYPELRGRRDLYDQVARDLRARGFLNSGDDVLHNMMSGSGLAEKRTTKMGDRFMAFIQEPPELQP